MKANSSGVEAYNYPKSLFKRLVKTIAGKLYRLFEPEEVEVTFKVEGKNVTYTYTKVEHKQVA